MTEVVAVYDAMAESYDHVDAEPFYSNQYRAYDRMLRRHLPERCESALDLGCGTGIFTELVAKTSVRVVGIDVATGLLAKARAKCQKYRNVEILEGSATTLPFGSSEFDLVISFGETLSHMQDYEHAFSEAGRVLTPGGLFVFSVINKWCFRLVYSPSEFSSAISSKGGYWRVWKCEDDSGNATELPLRTFTRAEIERLTQKDGIRIFDSCGIHISSLLVPLRLQRHRHSFWGRMYSCLGRIDEGLARHWPFRNLGYTCMYAARKDSELSAG